MKIWQRDAFHLLILIAVLLYGWAFAAGFATDRAEEMEAARVSRIVAEQTDERN